MSIPFPHDETNKLHLRLGVVFGGAIAASSTAYSTTHSVFTAADVGQPITIIGAGALVGARGALLVTTVAVYHSPTSVDLADAAVTTVAEDSENTTLFRDRGALIGTIQWRDSLTVNQTMTFTIRDQQPFPVCDQPVLLSLDGFPLPLFGGFLTRVKRMNLPKHPGGSTGWKDAECTAVSWDKLIYRRVTGQPTTVSGSPAVTNPDNGVFTNKTLFDIFEYLVINALGADGISITGVTGPVIKQFTVDYAACGDAFDQAIQAANSSTSTFHWYVDPFKVVTIGDQSTVPAPWDISDLIGSDDDIMVQVGVEQTDQDYVNVAFVRASALITDPISTTFHGDGVTRTFDLDGPTADTPVITLNGGAQTVGVLNIDTGKDWYYQIGSVTITQSNTGTILTGGDSLLVVGKQTTSGIVRYDNQTAIDAESLIEGGTGLWEAVMQTDAPSAQSDAVALAKAFATQYAVKPRLLDYYTYRPGIRVGQKQHVKLSDIEVDDDFLISSVEMTTAGNRMLFHVQGVGSPLTNQDWRATLATLRPGGGAASGSAGGPIIPYEVVFVVPQSIARVQANDVTENHRRITVNQAGTNFFLSAVYLTPKSPTGLSPATSLIVDVLVSQDEGVTWTSIFPAGNLNKIVLPAGSRGVSYTPDPWTINPIADGWLLRLDILQTTGLQAGFEVSVYGAIR